jgi:DNA repair protein RAD5
MSAPDVEERPHKKRRFFAEESPIAEKFPHPENPLPNSDVLAEKSPNALARQNTPSKFQSASSQTDASSYHDDAATAKVETSGFDKQLFESFVGEEVPADIMQRLKEAAGDSMERAINLYLDGSWKKFSIIRSPSNPNKDAFSTGLPAREAQKPPLVEVPNQPASMHIEQLDSMPDHRYVGAFGVGAWATRSGPSLICHGESVKIERTKIKPPVKTGRGGKIIQPSKGIAARMRTDIIVRFTNSKGNEIGRLPKDTAAWVSTLMDHKVCRFDGTCVFAPDRVRVNDTIYLQLKCSLVKKALEAGNFIKPQDNNRTTGIFEEKETSEEKDLRLRQVALVKLFEEINLHPSTINDTTAKHKRQGILQAAEIAEQYDKDNDGKKPKFSQEDGSSPPADDETEDGKELEQDQLDSLYKKAQSFDFNTPIREPADTFVMDLRKYQKQALHWMMDKEKDEKSEYKERSMHPLWEQYTWPIKDMDDHEVPGVANQDSFYVNLYSGELSLDFPEQEQHCLGGILADEMGLGKTIEMLSLMHSHRSEVSIQSSGSGPTSVANLPRLPKNSSSVEAAPCTTLVVAPMSLLAQWESEAEKASKLGTLKTLVYYGSEKVASLRNLCCEANAASAPNLVITSYGVVLSEFNQVAARGGDRGSHGGLFSLDFFRVILDEAHFIKNRQSKTAKACYDITAHHRWVLTGTPIVNRLEDLFSLVRFLRVEPWSNFSFWKTFITVPFESKDFIRALDVVQTVLEPLVLRRTKDMKTPDGQALVPLPPRIIEIEEIELSKQEREVYDYIFTRAKRTFNATMEAGTLLKSYTTIFAQILRLRQSCCHPILTRNKAIAAEEEEAAAAADVAHGLADDMDLQELIERFTTDSGDQDIANKFGAHVLQQIQSEAGHECPICTEEPMIEPAVTGCWHSACKKCLLDYIDHQKDKHALPLCFNCREPINRRDIFEIMRETDPSDSSNDLYSATPPANGSPRTPLQPPRISLRRIGSDCSAKIAALVSHLKTIRAQDPSTKSVVFSQFTSFLDLISPALSRVNIPFLRFDGAMSQKARAAVLTEFSSAKKGTVLLLSLRAGGVGLNLTSAKRVFMMDPWWSFAVEAQAIDRVHRMGQEEEVRVVRFVVAGSIEGRMLRIQERKKFM